jgi:hypothetical protein
MEPKLDLSDITIGGYESEDTITLSSYPWSNTTIAGGGYTVSNASVTATSYPYTVTGSNTAPLTIGAGTGISYPNWSNSISPKIRLDGDGADIEVNGASLLGMIKKIEERLNILHPNEKMEAEWDQLRELGEQYRALEAKLKEQGEMWAKLKAMPPPEVS